MSMHSSSGQEPGGKSAPVISKLKRTPEDYIKERVQYKINEYVKKGFRYRIAYRVLASIAAIGAALVPALINIPDLRTIYPTMASMAVAVAVALEGVFHTREHWRNYDMISAFLREEEMRFSTRAEPYAREQSEDQSFKTFVDRIEDAIAKERAETIVQRTKAPESK